MLVTPLFLLGLGVCFLLQMPPTIGEAPITKYRGFSVDGMKGSDIKAPFAKELMFRNSGTIPVSPQKISTLCNIAKQVTVDSSNREKKRVEEEFRKEGYRFKLHMIESLKELSNTFSKAVITKKQMSSSIIIGFAGYGERIKSARDDQEAVIDLKYCDFYIAPYKIDLGKEYEPCSLHKSHMLEQIKRRQPSYTCVPSEHGRFSLISIEEGIEGKVVKKYDYRGADTVRVLGYDPYLWGNM